MNDDEINLRDTFAGLAMQALIQHQVPHTQDERTDVAAMAYAQAETMMRVRPPPGPPPLSQEEAQQIVDRTLGFLPLLKGREDEREDGAH